jgi:hypothetical protein
VNFPNGAVIHFFNPTADLTIRLSISSLVVFLAGLLDVLHILCRVSSLAPRPFIPLL